MKTLCAKLPPNIIRGIEVPHLTRIDKYGFETHAKKALECAKEYFGEA